MIHKYKLRKEIIHIDPKGKLPYGVGKHVTFNKISYTILGHQKFEEPEKFRLIDIAETFVYPLD